MTTSATITALKTIRDNLLTRLTELSECPKPTYTVDGRSFSWVDYQRMLLDQIRDIEEELAKQPFIVSQRHVL